MRLVFNAIMLTEKLPNKLFLVIGLISQKRQENFVDLKVVKISFQHLLPLVWPYRLAFMMPPNKFALIKKVFVVLTLIKPLVTLVLQILRPVIGIQIVNVLNSISVQTLLNKLSVYQLKDVVTLRKIVLLHVLPKIAKMSFKWQTLVNFMKHLRINFKFVN